MNIDTSKTTIPTNIEPVVTSIFIMSIYKFSTPKIMQVNNC